MVRRFVFAILSGMLLVVGVAPVAAQQPDTSALTLEAIHANRSFAPDRFRGGRWADEGPVVTYIQSADTGDVTHLMRYNLETEARTQVIDGTNLYAQDVGRIVPIQDYAFGPENEKVLIYTDSKEVWRANTKGFYYVYDRSEQTLTPIADREDGYQMFAKFNPSATEVAFVRERNLHRVDLKTGTEVALTADGGEGAIINGTFDWVYEEEFGLRDGWKWSPDGEQIAFFKLDESETRTFTLTDQTTRYPEFTRFRYPKAGEKNSEIKVGVIDLGAVEPDREGQPQATTYFNTKTWKAGGAGGTRQEYLSRMGWTPEVNGTHQVWMFRMNRNQNRLDILYGDPETGTLRTVVQENSDTYIDISDGKIEFLDDGEHFVLMSERTGYRHAHLYRTDGAYVGPITDGNWEVTDFHGVNEETLVAYFTATRDTSIERHLYRAGVSLGQHEAAMQPEKITETPGWHSIDMSNDRAYYIDVYSHKDRPPSWTLRTADGARVTTLESNKSLRQRLDSLRLPTTTFTTLPAANGTPLNAYIVKPRDFDRSEPHPVLFYVYGGPGAQTVTDQWGGSRHLWHQYLAREYGIVVVSVDNRGTGGRGKAFQDIPYQRLGQPESADQIHAAQALADSSWADADRMGIWGWSYGGYMTLMSMLSGEGPSTFTAGLAVAPVTDWRLYDTIYTERYMSTPQRNEDGYVNGAPQTYADQMRASQDLILVHGDHDDNVHPQNTIQMMNQLQQAGKQFRLMMYPNRDHGIGGNGARIHLFETLTQTLEDGLVQP